MPSEDLQPQPPLREPYSRIDALFYASLRRQEEVLVKQEEQEKVVRMMSYDYACRCQCRGAPALEGKLFNVAIIHPHHYSARVYLHYSFISAPTAAQVTIDGNALVYVVVNGCAHSGHTLKSDPMMPQPKGKRRAAAAFDWHDIEEDDDRSIDCQEPRTTRFRHTGYNLDATGNSSYATTYLTAPASPNKRPAHGSGLVDEEDMDSLPQLQDCPDSDNDNDNDDRKGDAELDLQYQRHIIQLSDADAPRRKLRTTADNPTKKWLDDDRDMFLRELLRWDDCGDHMHALKCPACGDAADPTVRCHDCYEGSLTCVNCAVATHAVHPTHRVERWNTSHFEPTTLKALGLRIQLGHSVGELCINPIPTAGDDFVIVDTNGIHQVALDYCGCASAKVATVQLLRARLYPATVQAPKTAATFNMLEFFHRLTFQSKASAFECYYTLARRTDNTGTLHIPDRYDEFLRMIRQWRNLKMLKRAGRGHDPSGVAGTKEGECAVLCPACPQPGKNLPPEWREAPENTRFIFELLLAADANFRMMSKYREHLAKYGDQKEIHSTCVKHHAVGDANTSRFANLVASGIGTVDCTRHMMKRPTSVGELQKGERYANMDYLFFSSTSQQDYVRLVMSYDIVCQWSVHLWGRMLDLPGYVHIDREDKQFVFLIPKFHLPAHTDGEAPERGWANINPLSSSAKRMGPASYRETIDDHFGDWNWQRIVGLGRMLLQKLKLTVECRDEHVEDFHDFTTTLPANNILDWASAVEGWEKQNEQVNLYVSVSKKDAEDLQSDAAAPLHEQVTPGLFISMGLELEAQQIWLKADAKALDASATTLQLAKMQEHKNSLYRKLKTWTDIQQLYMPEVFVLRAREERAGADSTREVPSHDIALHLPSSLPLRTPASQKLVEYEFRLRMAQAFEALEEIRWHLRLRMHMYRYKDRHVVDASAMKYTRARNAPATLASRTGAVGWDTQLQELSDEDIRAFTDDSEKERECKGRKTAQGKKGNAAQKKAQALGEGHKTLSWIWKVVGVQDDGNDEGVQEALHIEWCRARARAMRWSEEVLLLREEMRRVQGFSQWQADWWTGQTRHLADLPPEDAEGIGAYAAKQASIRLQMASSFDHLWRTEWLSIPHGAGADNELLDLEPSASSFLTDYPAAPFSSV
ncbi:hypothetical protein FIBSPDRAFT_944525 [Athelia psychrophila]|uniref:CxC2-like cysteine cluster KDZ transposase-associated domain-containing protein n=1 Tax=Athelia psychrophila TaxID=1759441 RepID=A0A166UPJ8_9AGAM|nr:hypothetical protein FIBSPDRAFT_944525 [Fibularhizoctonia sp. CBS 109695]